MKKKIVTRLYAGFTLAIILVVGVGVVSYETVQRQTFFQKSVKHSYEVTDKVKELQTNILELQSARRAYRLTGRDTFLLLYKTNAPALFGEINVIKDSVQDNPVQSQRMDSLANLLRDLVGFWEVSLPGQTATEASRTQITLQEESRIAAPRNLLNTVIQEEQRLLQQREDDDKAANSQASQVLTWGILLILLIVFVLIYLILREFKNRATSDAELKKSYNDIKALADDADKKNWQLTGITKITDGMHAAYSLAGLVNNIIKNTLDYIGLPAAVFYLFDEDRQLLEVKSSAGTAVREDVTFKPFALPGGLPGIREVKIIKQVPPGFWEIRSAMGASKPVELASMGLYIGRELKGVLELASFTPFSSQQIDLLRSISDNMAVSLHAAQTRERVIRLLEQVQEQKEALENQQEELRLSNDELTRQAGILQASEEELKVQEQELRHINTELEEKNKAVETARNALQEKAKELDAVSRYKSEFLANMSHELRTPLNSILILARMLADNKHQNLTGKQAEYASIIYKSGNELLGLINDILDLSKIEAGKVEINGEGVTAQNIADDLSPQFKILAEEKRLNFVTIVDDDTAPITTDKQKVEQVVKNLLSNAFKFTPAFGTVTLHFFDPESYLAGDTELAELWCGGLGISVTDTGIGISPEKQKLIFEAFQQADGSTSRKFGGTGLGLSISKELVRLLGGEIRVASQAGEGSTFTVFLPPQLPGAQNEGSKHPGFSKPAAGVSQELVKDDRDAIEPGDNVLLIVEDDVRFATILQDFARERHYKTVIALSGDEGLMYASKYVPAAIILDLQLPVLDGRSVLKALKKNGRLQHIPVHIISVMENVQGLADGALAYLKKPVDQQGLEKAFNAIASHIASNIKKILFVSGGRLNHADVKQLLQASKITAQTTEIKTIQQALGQLEKEKYDCIITDLGTDINAGIEQLKRLHAHGGFAETPLIIYLDDDISQEDEIKLKKFSSVVIRHSEYARQRLIDEMELFLYKIQQSQKTPQVAGAPILKDDLLNGKKVLIVDDDMRNVFALTVALEEHKMIVCTANDGREALQVLAKNKDVAIVLMDIMMPEMDGYEAIRNIRQAMNLANLPVIALTAKAMQGDYEKSMEAGATDYITKPVDINKVLSVMRVWLTQ